MTSSYTTSTNYYKDWDPRYCRECGDALIYKWYMGSYYLICPHYDVLASIEHDRYARAKPINFDPKTGQPYVRTENTELPSFGQQYISAPKPKWMKKVKNWLKQLEKDD